MPTCLTNHLAEWTLTAAAPPADPFGAVDVDVLVTGPDARTQRVPAFWAGGATWRVRYSTPEPGRYRWGSVCSDPAQAGLHDQCGELEVGPYTGDHPLHRHGPLRVAADRRYLEHRDGTPFYWLGDTWWMGLTDRLGWPDEWDTLVADRVAKGFTLVQIVAGLYPDMPAHDPRGANEGGQAWTPGWGAVNPAWYDAADRKLLSLVAAGLTPCVVGCWGYYLPWLGVASMKRHWRHLIARYGALPVVWCLAGEGTMPWYLSTTREADAAQLKAGWSELARYVRATDPFARPLTIHPTQSGRAQVEDPALLDFDMLQTGHSDRGSLASTARLVSAAWQTEPTMPVVEGEVCYEGIGEACRQEVQRLMFWTAFLAGARGFTYGANGLWQLNRADRPYGASPHGMSWGGPPWPDAMALPGGGQLGLAKRLLERYAWWRCAPHPEWVDAPDTPAGGIPGELRLVYLAAGHAWNPPALTALEPGVRYQAFLHSPVDGAEHPLGEATADADGRWRLPLARLPVFQDWVVVLTR